MFELIAAVCLKIVKLLFTCFAFSTICSWLVKPDSKEVCGRGVGALLAFCALLLLFGDDSRLSGLDNFGVEDASWPIWENTEKVKFNEKFVTFLNNKIYHSHNKPTPYYEQGKLVDLAVVVYVGLPTHAITRCTTKKDYN